MKKQIGRLVLDGVGTALVVAVLASLFWII